jgi:hypothetical protein
VVLNHQPSPSSALIIPPIPSSISLGPYLEISPWSDQNWMDEDSSMAYVKEEIHMVPPQIPMDSLMFSASDLQDSHHNYG